MIYTEVSTHTKINVTKPHSLPSVIMAAWYMKQKGTICMQIMCSAVMYMQYLELTAFRYINVLLYGMYLLYGFVHDMLLTT